MNLRFHTIVLSAAVACMLVPALRTHAAEPATQPAKGVTTDMQVQTLAGMTFLYVTTETTFDQLPTIAPPMLDGLITAAMKAGIHFKGPCSFIYENVKGPDKPVTVLMGFPVDADTKPPEGTKIRTYEKFRCATALHTGPMRTLHTAYMKLYQQLAQAGLKPTTDAREMYLLFETADSPNDVTLIQIGLEPAEGKF